MKDTSGSAFPSKRFAVNDEERDTMGYCVEQGMTLRDYFAGQALIAKFSNDEYIRDLYKVVGMEKTNIIASDCYAIADAMLAERLK